MGGMFPSAPLLSVSNISTERVVHFLEASAGFYPADLPFFFLFLSSSINEHVEVIIVKMVAIKCKSAAKICKS